MTNIINMILASNYYCNMFFLRSLGILQKQSCKKQPPFSEDFLRALDFFPPGPVDGGAIAVPQSQGSDFFLRQKNIWGFQGNSIFSYFEELMFIDF